LAADDDGIRLEKTEPKAGRIVADELARRRWTVDDLAARLKGNPTKPPLAARLREETTSLLPPIAERPTD